jgi:2'-5' RNA ligase
VTHSPEPALLETAVVIVVDEPGLAGIYRSFFPGFAALGIPLHITLLYPFVPPDALEAALPDLAAVIARYERFAFTLTDLRTFPRAVWVAPDPAAPFRALTGAIETAFPAYPHWGGQYAEAIPHMTLVDGVEEDALLSTLARLRQQTEPILPVVLVADEVTVLAEREDGHMVIAARLPLGRTADGFSV